MSKMAKSQKCPISQKQRQQARTELALKIYLENVMYVLYFLRYPVNSHRIWTALDRMPQI